MTLLAGSVPAAQRLLAERLKTAVPVYDGRYGRSVRVGPERTMGVWMEFAQYLVPPGK